MHKNQPGNFAARKQRKREKRTRFSPKKAKPGAFWVLEGMRTVAGRCERMGGPKKIVGRTCLGCRLGRFAAERHWRSLTPRHALRRAQPHLVAEPLCPLTKNREASIVLTSLFLAGAEGLEPSARGFGVAMETQSRGRRTGSVVRFSQPSSKEVVLIWCCK